ncbi:hypothetical protein MRB53_038498 [Persea americana]|nr:hypothetical protein MRB53_038498 [Persea americana]
MLMHFMLAWWQVPCCSSWTSSDYTTSARRSTRKSMRYICRGTRALPPEFIAVLRSLTSAYPDLWNGKGKSTRLASLASFVKLGSQTSTSDVLGQSLWPASRYSHRKLDPGRFLGISFLGISSDRCDFAGKSKGLTGAAAWQCYINAVTSVLSELPTSTQAKLVEEHLIPLLKQYLKPVEDGTVWTMPGIMSITSRANVFAEGPGAEAFRWHASPAGRCADL